MKRTIAILVMLALVLSLVACGIKDTGGNSSSEENSISINESIPKDIVSEVKVASENAESVINESAPNGMVSEVTVANKKAESSINNASSKATKTSTPSKETTSSKSSHTPKIFINNGLERYTKKDIDRYLEFVKYEIRRYEEKGDVTVDAAVPFYKWMSTRQSILLPTVEDKSFQLLNISNIDNKVGYSLTYCMSGNNSKNIRPICVHLYPIEEEADLEKDLLTLAKKCADKKAEFVKGTEECKWGEYYEEKGNANAYFRYNDYIICVTLQNIHTTEHNPPFEPEYFNYFDLEYVSLED